METSLPVVAIIGRPNVGKSTLFNSFIGERRAIVSEIAGTTRDSLMEKIDDLGKVEYWLVDTAGLSDFGGDSLEDEIQMQAELAMENADLILWVVDGREPITLDDRKIAEKLRKGKVPVLFVANKIDDGAQDKVFEFAELGFGLPEAVSGKNNFGFWDLTERLQEELKTMGYQPTPEKPEPEEGEELPEETEEDGVVKVAFIGRPNVGKSSLLNAFVGKKRAVVSDVAGTTRDSIDEFYTDEEGREFCFIDTAGLRKPGKIEKNFEFWSSVRTQQSIERADICVLLIDALDGVTHQDLALAGKAKEAGKGVILLVNKFDLVREKARTEDETDEREHEEIEMWGEEISVIRDRYLRYLQRKIKFLPWAPVLFCSAQKGKGMPDILDSIVNIASERKKRIPTAELNRLMPEIYFSTVIPTSGAKKGKIKMASQVDTAPPKFLIFVNNTQAFHWSYQRYIENKLREKYGFFGTPITVEFRDSMQNFRGRSKPE